MTMKPHETSEINIFTMENSQLQPQSVFHYFSIINKIPRPSGKEEQMMAYLHKFAKEHGLESMQDETGNVLIRKPATPGYENRKTTVLQSHMDMVCEKEAGLEFNFLTDPIQTEVQGEWLTAKGTTLGADDGIGGAIQLAILANTHLEHGPLECLFTRSEETSLTGAFGLDPHMLQGEYLINLDSEDEGQIFISCAGGANTRAWFDTIYEEAPQDSFFFRMQVKGLVGGHSGDDINKKRANANILLFRLISRLRKDFGLRLADVQSGGLHNAIPRDGYALCCVPNRHKEDVRIAFNIMTAEIEEEYNTTEKGITFILESIEPQTVVLETSLTDRLIKAILGVPNGVLAMSQDIPDFVETSSNLASVRIKDGKIHIETMQRSNLTSKRLATCEAVSGVFELAGAHVDVNTGYPGWYLDPSSPFLQMAVAAYKHLFGRNPEVKAIHAGLECGLFSEKYPHMDMISIGPTLRGVHSPDERLLIPTVQQVWDHFLEILRNIPVR